MHRKSTFYHSLHIAKNRNSPVNVSENVYSSFHLKIPSNGVSMTHSFNFTRDCSLIQSPVTLFKLCFKLAILQQNCFRIKLQILTILRNLFFLTQIYPQFWTEIVTKKRKGKKVVQNILTKANTQPGKKKIGVHLLNNDHDKKTYTKAKQV